MTALLTIKREFCPLSRDWGYSVRHETTGDSCWNFNRSNAIRILMERLALKGYDRSFVSH